MNVFLYMARQVSLGRKRKQLRRLNDWIAQLEDQVMSGQASLKYWRAKRDQVEGQIALLTPPDELFERAET